MPQDTWYFAYGSNMSVDRKEERTGTIRQALRCRLNGYRLAFNKRAGDGSVYANIIPDEKSEVWGVAYLCDEAAMRKLDKKEGVAGGHYVRANVVVNASDRLLECVTYIAGPNYVCDEGIPARDYLQLILDGVRDHDLPAWYQEDIRRLATPVKSSPEQEA